MRRSIASASVRCRATRRPSIRRLAQRRHASTDDAILAQQLEEAVVISPPSIWRAVAFCGSVSLVTFAWAAERTNYKADRISADLDASSRSSFWPSSSSTHTSARLFAQRRREEIARAQSVVTKWASSSSETIGRIIVLAAEKWINTSDGERICYGLIASQAVVFLAWQLPIFTPFMVCTDPRFLALLTRMIRQGTFCPGRCRGAPTQT